MQADVANESSSYSDQGTLVTLLKSHFNTPTYFFSKFFFYYNIMLTEDNLQILL